MQMGDTLIVDLADEIAIAARETHAHVMAPPGLPKPSGQRGARSRQHARSRVRAAGKGSLCVTVPRSVAPKCVGRCCTGDG
jgi:hypothetical protein